MLKQKLQKDVVGIIKINSPHEYRYSSPRHACTSYLNKDRLPETIFFDKEPFSNRLIKEIRSVQ